VETQILNSCHENSFDPHIWLQFVSETLHPLHPRCKSNARIQIYHYLEGLVTWLVFFGSTCRITGNDLVNLVGYPQLLHSDFHLQAEEKLQKEMIFFNQSTGQCPANCEVGKPHEAPPTSKPAACLIMGDNLAVTKLSILIFIVAILPFGNSHNGYSSNQTWQADIHWHPL